jgi:uncharacterized membrane protein YbhN (UPF0104 family)
MRGKRRRWWPVLKALLSLAILFVIGRQFALDLRRPELWRRPVHPGWLVLSAGIYLLGLSLSALYWYRLLLHLGSRPPLGQAFRAYFIGHLGKYLPGKAWALFLRASLVRGTGVSLGRATLTGFYEVITTMAAGALLAAVLFALFGEDRGLGLTGQTLGRLVRLQLDETEGVGRTLAVALALLLLAVTGLPLLPPLFNRVVHHLSLPFRDPEADSVPPIRLHYLMEGLLLTGVGWLLVGASLACALCGVVGPDLPWSGAMLGRLSAMMAIAYVAGFVILLAPSGLGVREYLLTLFLVPQLVNGTEAGEARGLAVLTVLVLRLVWTVAELLLAGSLYWMGRS